MKLKLFISIFLIFFSCTETRKEKQRTPAFQKTEIDTISKNIIDTVSRVEKIVGINDTIKKETFSINDIFEKTLKREFYDAELFSLVDTLESDFNGDKFADKAVFTSSESKKGIIIFDGKTDLKTKIGLGIPFEEMGDDFGWVDFWGLVKDSTTYEVIIEDGEIYGDTIIKLKNPSIVLRKLEAGGGLIMFNGNNYEWIHQSD